jgi:hypothetical protein
MLWCSPKLGEQQQKYDISFHPTCQYSSSMPSSPLYYVKIASCELQAPLSQFKRPPFSSATHPLTANFHPPQSSSNQPAQRLPATAATSGSSSLSPPLTVDTPIFVWAWMREASLFLSSAVVHRCCLAQHKSRTKQDRITCCLGWRS